MGWALFGLIRGYYVWPGGMSIEAQVQDVLDLHHCVADVIQERKYDRRDDLISYIWDQRDSGVQMTDFEHLYIIPGLLLAFMKRRQVFSRWVYLIFSIMVSGRQQRIMKQQPLNISRNSSATSPR